MNIKEKTVFHICRHKELANILKEGEIFYTDRFTLEPYHKDGKNQKEISAERARIKVDPNLPIRTKSMHICLEKDLEKWKNKLITANHKWYRIFKLSATGKVFWADSYEYDGGNYAKYWQGCDPNSEEARIEGLFQGKYQILETIEKKG